MELITVAQPSRAGNIMYNYTVHLPNRKDHIPRGLHRATLRERRQSELGSATRVLYATSFLSPLRWFSIFGIFQAGNGEVIGRPVVVVESNFPWEMLSCAIANELTELSGQLITINSAPLDEYSSPREQRDSAIKRFRDWVARTSEGLSVATILAIPYIIFMRNLKRRKKQRARP